MAMQWEQKTNRDTTVLLKAYFSDFNVLLPHHMTSVDVKKKK